MKFVEARETLKDLLTSLVAENKLRLTVAEDNSFSYTASVSNPRGFAELPKAQQLAIKGTKDFPSRLLVVNLSVSKNSINEELVLKVNGFENKEELRRKLKFRSSDDIEEFLNVSVGFLDVVFEENLKLQEKHWAESANAEVSKPVQAAENLMNILEGTDDTRVSGEVARGQVNWQTPVGEFRFRFNEDVGIKEVVAWLEMTAKLAKQAA